MCVVIFPSPEDRGHLGVMPVPACGVRYGMNHFGGTPAKWNELDGVDLQETADVGCVVLARYVESAHTSSHSSMI